MNKFFYTLICLIPITSFCRTGTWNIVYLKVNTSKKWSFFGEAQLRSLKAYTHFHYYEFKTGVSFSLKKNLSLTSGLGNYNTYAEGGNFKRPMVNKEFRTWLQLSTKQNYGRLTIENRYRAEQRWTSQGYRNRLRYRVNAMVPLNNQTIKKGTIYSMLWDEIFFTDRVPYFERNRWFVGIGYEINQSIAIQTGYLHQFDYKLNDETGRDFLQLSILFVITATKKKEEPNLPNTID